MAKNIKPRKKLTKVFQFFAAYLVAAWTLLQFLDWIFNRYQLSPHWIDIFLWVFIGVIPSLLIYLYHQNRINKRIFHLREKIIFPLNFLFILAFFIMSFNSKDLSAKTKDISFTNAAGTLEHKTILKDKYRTGIPFFNFDQKSNDSTNAWVSYAIPFLLYHDVLQDKNVNTNDLAGSTTTEKVNATKSTSKFYVDGTYEVKDSVYTVIPTLRNSTNGKLIASKSFKNNDLLQLLDSVSIYVREQAGITETQRDQYVDLKLEEFMSSNFEAIKYFIKYTATRNFANIYKSIELDSTFSFAYLNVGKTLLRWNLGILEAQLLFDKAYKFRSKLPYDKQFEVMLFKYMAYKEWGKAEQFAKLQLKIYPKSRPLHNALFQIYSVTKRLDAYYKLAKENYKINPIRENLNSLNMARISVGKIEESLNVTKEFIKLNPEDNWFKVELLALQLINGNLIEARKTLDEINVLYPEWSNTTKAFEHPLDYQNTHKITKKDLSIFEGEYVYHLSELTREFWVQNGMLIKLGSNQEITYPIIAGPLRLVSGWAGGRTAMHDFIQDKNGRIYLERAEQNDIGRTKINYFWKLDESIKKGEALLKKGDLERAEDTYKIAIAANPYHFYLKDALKHIQYVKSTDPEVLKKQYEAVVGQYGSRKIWLENGKLYSRKDKNPRVVLIPINKTRYMSHSIKGIQSEFDYENGMPMGVFDWSFIVEDMAWKKLDKQYNAKN